MKKVKKPAGVLSAVTKVRGGVAVSHNKHTADFAVKRIPVPQTVVLPMQQHIGAPCIPTVKPGDEVGIGQVIGDTDKFVSAPIHATVSGVVKSVGDVKLPNGVITKGVTIESDGEMRNYEGLEKPDVTDLPSFIKAVRASGLVGLGGAVLQHHSSEASILRCSAFFMVLLSHPYLTTGKAKALMLWTFVRKVMSLLFNMLSRLFIAFLPRCKCL